MKKTFTSGVLLNKGRRSPLINLKNKYKIMKKNYFTKGFIALAILAALGGGSVLMVKAASNETIAATKATATRLFKNSQQRPVLTAEQKAAFEKERTARQAEQKTRQTAIESAFNNNDYQAWLSAVGSDCPLADKINATNFPKLVEAHKLQTQADQIMTDLGIEKMGGGEMSGLRMGHNRAAGFKGRVNVNQE